MMNAIKATWTNGQIVPAEPVDWPEGSKVQVVPLQDAIGMPEDEWRDDPESIAAWIAAVDRIEPLIWGPGEEEAYNRYRAEQKQFNLAAVRKQMYGVPEGDAK